jgi:hypothetical protein
VTAPISPKDVESAKTARIPPEVIEAANELIAEKWNGYSALFTITELCERARPKLKMEPGSQFKTGQLDIEVVFRKAGWLVDYDNPGYNETYTGFWTFKKRWTR